MLNKKLKKLIRDPNLFFSDMVLKQKKKYAHFYTKKVDGHYNYTIVSAVYNVQDYLDDYFKSIINQTLNFKKHIKLILIDDGSTDKSAAIIKKWANKYPRNITYVGKENGGQASARNMGLNYVNTEYVTFLDPDDFLDKEYFYQVDDFLNKHKNVNFATSNIIFYVEKSKKYSDTHPLRQKYKNGDVLLPFNQSYSEIQLSASSSIFKTQYINNNSIRFNTDVKPNFEDGRFICEYLLSLSSGDVAFLQSAKYFYRKREDGSSTLDSAWSQLERFTHVPKYGYLYILEQALTKFGTVPIFIQKSILYEMVWNIKYIVNHPERLGLLSELQKKEYFEDIKKIFSYLDAETILKFSSAGCWFYHKVGMLACFKNEVPLNKISYIENYDAKKDLVLIRYFTKDLVTEHIYADGADQIPLYAKTITHDFIDNVFILERRLWVSVKNIKHMKFFVSGVQTKISLNGKQRADGINIDDIKKHFINIIPKYNRDEKYQNSWILMDRDSQADDNAEHFYRYISKEHPEQRVFFVLRRDSHDWQRLLNDGFNLIEFGTQQHENALMSCTKLISSHADKYVTNYLGPRMLAGRHYVFLQHGVTKDDLSGWLNQKEYIDCLITSSQAEYDSIANDGTKYNYGKKEVVLTGFPRHDKLMQVEGNNQRILIIMPTWRLGIVGSVKNGGNERDINPEFMQTDYAQHWSSLLRSSKLKELCELYNFKVIFFPHANIQCYLSMLHVPEYIEIVKHTSTTSIQELFMKSTLMITDYSSVAFEMAIQNKQTLYYQFDEDQCFNGGHIYAKGYFDYRKDGFGAVSVNENELLSSLELAFKNDGLPDEVILSRMYKTFAYHDNNNSKRVYEAITALDQPLEEGLVDPILLKDYAKKAILGENWPLAESRWRRYFELENGEKTSSDLLQFCIALRMQGKFAPAQNIINGLMHDIIYRDNLYNDIIHEQVLLYMAQCKWQAAANILTQFDSPNADKYLYYTCLAFTKNADKLKSLLALNEQDYFYLSSCIDFANENWENVAKSLNIDSEYFDVEKIYPYHLLLQANAFIMISDFKSAHKSLITYESIRTDNVHCRYTIAKLAFLNNNYSKVISQLHVACDDISFLPLEYLYYLTISLIKSNKDVDDIRNLIENIKSEIAVDRRYCARIMAALGKWDEASTIWSAIALENDGDVYEYSSALKNIGDYSNAYRVLSANEYLLTYKTWNLRSELAQLNDRWDDAYISWQKYLQTMPTKANIENLDKLQRLKLLSGIDAHSAKTFTNN